MQICEQQHGFMPGKSTTGAIFENGYGAIERRARGAALHVCGFGESL